MTRGLVILSTVALSFPASAQAADSLMTSADGAVVFRGSYGITAIEANELVYEGKSKVSQLIWKSSAVSTFTGDVKVDLDRFFLRATAAIGIEGDGNMRDYDWFVAGKPWTHRSIHPDTRLNHYFAGSIEAGRAILDYDGTTVSLGGGAKYTDVKWAAWGGSYIYSDPASGRTAASSMTTTRASATVSNGLSPSWVSILRMSRDNGPFRGPSRAASPSRARAPTITGCANCASSTISRPRRR
jgi:outer membrane protease